jgi:hypothetical protein
MELFLTSGRTAFACAHGTNRNQLCRWPATVCVWFWMWKPSRLNSRILVPYCAARAVIFGNGTHWPRAETSRPKILSRWLFVSIRSKKHFPRAFEKSYLPKLWARALSLTSFPFQKNRDALLKSFLLLPLMLPLFHV